jgi:hypothetical protein
VANPDEICWLLALDGMLFQAEVRWLDRCEASLVRYSPPTTSWALPQAEHDGEVVR